ncbi:hotdog fold thioesterase [Caulobacter sp. SLTY]|uniref:PaaI family thioesterase n=1 Tax=Caulobacter sp. SLTY TaxID=2683262 RepID=UPI0014133572|nr:PaaI family thioesterase [Caulobacter sp. SLTY]NBB15520.1 hotdog fold thioesterase [Caulobacter sp. SLTY]
MIREDVTGKAGLRLDAPALNAFLARAFPEGDPERMPKVTSVGAGVAVMAMPTDAGHLRPGGVISGPTQMSLADSAAYMVILAHIGEVAMAVTTSLTIHFLRPCKPGTLIAEARLLKLGRRIATVDVLLYTEGPDRPAAKATVAYAIPDGANG